MQTHIFDDVTKMTPSIIQLAALRHLREIAEGYSHELVCDTYYRNVEQCVTYQLSLVMVLNLYGHNKTNFSTIKLVKWSVNRVKDIKYTIFTVLQWNTWKTQWGGLIATQVWWAQNHMKWRNAYLCIQLSAQDYTTFCFATISRKWRERRTYAILCNFL